MLRRLTATIVAGCSSVVQKQAWFPLVAKASDRVQVWTRGERSFEVILLKSR